MLKHLACSTFALAIFLTGCSGGGSDPAGNPGVGFTEALQEAADCAGLSLEDADDLLRLFADLVIAVDTNMNVGDIIWNDPRFGAMVDLDGDGSLLMQLGSLVTIVAAGTSNLYHFVFANGFHQSTGKSSRPAIA